MKKELRKKIKEALKLADPSLTAKEIEAKMGDPRLKRALRIMASPVVKLVRCLKCKKALIKLNVAGDIVFEYPTYMARRFRFDGQWGYQCSCGNDSRVSKAEEEVMPEPKLLRSPNAEELEKIYENIKKKPPVVKHKKDGTLEVDNFAEEVI